MIRRSGAGPGAGGFASAVDMPGAIALASYPGKDPEQKFREADMQRRFSTGSAIAATSTAHGIALGAVLGVALGTLGGAAWAPPVKAASVKEF